ncbi:MAG: DUF72 domain-containing protein, partial [Actinomycetota bacterium]
MLLIGTSGWQYRDWRGAFYPQQLAQARWLEHYAERFRTVEVNNTFYRLPKAETFVAWRDRTPDDFVVVVKTSRYLSHIKRLKDPAPSIDLFMERARGLGEKLGPLLVQLPPTFQADPARLRDALAAFPGDVRLAVEFRHPSWQTEEVVSILAERNAALVMADRKGDAMWVRRTADWGFVRLHEGTGNPPPCYRRIDLERWAELIASHYAPDDDVFLFFNTDPRGCAVRN